MDESIGSEFKVKRGNSLRDKPWVVSTFVLGVLVVLILAGSLFNFSITGNAVSANKASKNFVSFADAQGVNAEVINITQEGSFYKVFVSIDGQEAPYYVTKDGKYFVSGGLVPLVTEEAAPSNTDTQTQETCWEDVALSLNMDVDKLNEFAYSEKGLNLLKEDSKLTSKYGISGSPTLMINNVKSSSVYSGTDSMKQSICSSFITSPVECKGVDKSSETNLSKSIKPVVDLYVMSYCPYGVKAETNIYPLIEFFGNKVDFNIRFIANVGGTSVNDVQSLHGLKEAKEDLNQIAIMQLYPEKFWDYLNEFNNVCYGGGASSSGSC